jgi:transposase InsO family protein
VRFQWIKDHRAEFPVKAMCRALEVSRSGFHAWMKSPARKRRLRRENLAGHVRRVFEKSRGRYGSPRITQALRAEGIGANRKAVARCMKELGIRAQTRASFVPRTTQSDPGLAASPNLLARDFSAERPNQKWCCDITYIDTDEGWLYAAIIKDLFSKKIVGWATADHMRDELTIAALRMAITHRGQVSGVIHHSDRGRQYASADYRAMLKDHGIVQSMSEVGDCYDNAPAESFFGSLKVELVNGTRFATRAEASLAVFEYIEVFYNRDRLHSALGYVSPVAYEAARG